MVSLPPVKFRRRRYVKAPKLPVASGPVLLAAGFDLLEVTLTLVFDRPVNSDLIDVSQFEVLDWTDSGRMYTAFGSDEPAVAVGSVRLSMQDAGPTTEGPSVMNATSANGIVAADDGAAWPGVMELGLPFP